MGNMKTALESLKRYQSDERLGLLLHLPVPLGTTVWRIQHNPACHPYVQDAETFLFGKVVTPPLIVEPAPFTLAMLDEWGKTVFTTKIEGEKKVRQQNGLAK